MNKYNLSHDVEEREMMTYFDALVQEVPIIQYLSVLSWLISTTCNAVLTNLKITVGLYSMKLNLFYKYIKNVIY